MTAPKLFISYCWSSQDHEKWVLDLATELCESGIDVILDKWNLKEGHDAIAFMEKMVTDPEIKKVVMICDEKYAKKADGRSGGVGTETQIISKEVYEQQAQDQFVAVLSARDADGKPYLPTYYKSRIYIDLSDAERYTPEFERLLRWVFDKPLNVKPPLGAAPTFLQDGDHVSLGTTAIFKRCIDAIKNQKPYAAGALDEYCDVFAANLERFRISNPQDGTFDDAVIKSIEEFLPFRNEAIQIFTAVAQYSPADEFTHRIHRLFESLLPYYHKPAAVSTWTDADFDNYKFLVHELFLYALAVLIKHSRFARASYLLERQYYAPWKLEYGLDVMVNFTAFYGILRSLEFRNQRLNSRRLSIRADLLKQRCLGIRIEFRDLMQADFVAFMRAEVDAKTDFGGWWPDTLVYLGHSNSPFEVFARAVSGAYFDQVKVLLGINSPKDLEPVLANFISGSQRLPRWGFDSINPPALLGNAKWATRA